MEFTEFMLYKALAVIAGIAAYEFWKGFTGSK